MYSAESLVLFGRELEFIHAETKQKTSTRLVLGLVQSLRKSFHEIRGEIDRWRQILEVPYQEYLSSRW